MAESPLLHLAASAGIATGWRDVFGAWHQVGPDTLASVLAALGLPAASPAQIQHSQAWLDAGFGQTLPPRLVGQCGLPLPLGAVPAGRWQVTLESGAVREGWRDAGADLPALSEPGYHRLELAGMVAELAIAPARCRSVADLLPGGRGFGVAAQLYSLRRPGDGGIGDFAALATLCQQAAAHGADLVAISPVHAQFSAEPGRFAPYSPSSRTAFTLLHAVPPIPLPAHLAEKAAALEAMELIDWPLAAPLRLAWLRAAFASRDGAHARAFAAFAANPDPALCQHAVFEALHAHFRAIGDELWHWRRWPEPYQDPASAAVAAFAEAHADAVEFHLYGQFLADSGLRAAQHAARAGGMRIGLVTDLAVGADGAGSDAWAGRGEMLHGLSIGAPPDLLNRAGQDWGLTGFSPTGLARTGYGAFLAMLRTALRHAGGVRIDHVMGLARLWLVPQGATADQGAYLHYPLTDLMRLVALESHRAGAVVLGEDLGTLPDGFQQVLDQQGLLGLRVLWFEQQDGAFRRPDGWSRNAVAMTSTHDLPTLCGWWTGQDLVLRAELGLLGDATAIYYAHETRARERAALWQVMVESGAASGPAPDPADWAGFVDAAIRHCGAAASALALLPLEDLLAAPDQPNLPGTIAIHPNWRRRLPLPTEALLAQPPVAARLAAFRQTRQ